MALAYTTDKTHKRIFGDVAVLDSGRMQPWVSVACGDCGINFPLSKRSALRARSEGREHRCLICRRPSTPLRDEERRTLWAWWIRRLGSMDEAVELAGLIWR